jgi:hypothetical protein
VAEPHGDRYPFRKHGELMGLDVTVARIVVRYRGRKLQRAHPEG